MARLLTATPNNPFRVAVLNYCWIGNVPIRRNPSQDVRVRKSHDCIMIHESHDVSLIFLYIYYLLFPRYSEEE